MKISQFCYFEENNKPTPNTESSDHRETGSLDAEQSAATYETVAYEGMLGNELYGAKPTLRQSDYNTLFTLQNDNKTEKSKNYNHLTVIDSSAKSLELSDTNQTKIKSMSMSNNDLYELPVTNQNKKTTESCNSAFEFNELYVDEATSDIYADYEEIKSPVVKN